MEGNIFSYYDETELFLEMFLESPKKVQQLLLLPLIKSNVFPEFWNDESIKSPIEQIFITAFQIYCNQKEKQQIYLFPQKEIIYNGKKYYLDFEFNADDLMTKNFFNKNIKNKKFKLAIECDGYNFHKKTKKQVQYDNEREFDLKMAGYDVLRFSGSQIYNNPLKCAKDTYKYIIKKIEEE